MKPLIKVAAIFDRALDYTTILAGSLLVFIMLSVCVEVIMRYFLESPILWVIEISEVNLLYITFLAAAWVLKKDGHVKMDLLLNRLRPRTQAMFGIVISIIGALVFIYVTWYGVQVTWDHFLRGTYRSTLMELPNYPILAIIPVGSFLLFIQFLRRAYGYIRNRRASGDTE